MPAKSATKRMSVANVKSMLVMGLLLAIYMPYLAIELYRELRARRVNDVD